MTKKFEMSMMGELTYFLRLQIKQDNKGISICQEPYTRNLLKKCEISDSSSVKTPMVPPNNLGPDLAGKPVNKTSYRGMIGSLMYLTAKMPDIQFFIVLCVRYQSNPKESHLTTVKRILRYIKGTPTLEKAPQVPVKYLVENWFVEVLRNSSQWLCPRLRLNTLMLLGVVQVLGGNYSSTEQVNSIQQFLAYSLITGTGVDIGEIIYSDLDPSKVTEIELTAHMIALNNRRDSVSPPPLVAKPKTCKSQTVISTSPKSQGLEASGALSKKSKRSKSKNPPTKTKATPPNPTKGFEQSHSVSSGTVPDP
ncbi:retrovirus-related pol polyprotein from transposon TNT 1-94 [Tanacetum coccineum]|uniref:Retrovirus-related pol polyprotein from transposon TNT 1-94 n=1 Tax=Tanacetum coccineum TaxID=301880 RepID=A0ABQ5C0D1_9ASTR